MSTESQIRLEPSWKCCLLDEFEKPYMRDLREFLRQEMSRRKVIYPKGSEYFNALNSTSFERSPKSPTNSPEDLWTTGHWPSGPGGGESSSS